MALSCQCRAMYSAGMRRVAYSLYLLPSKPGAGPRSGPRVSSWKMNANEAAAVGAVGIVPGTTEYRDIPETEAEHLKRLSSHPTAGRSGVEPPPGGRA